MPEVSVVIPTFRRPDMLRRALESCAAQAGMMPESYELVVVDNCPDGSARATVEAAAKALPVEIVYVHERQSGISHARNAGLAAARGRFVAFIDDDETASPGWLRHLLDAQAAHQADVVLAPVMFRPDDDSGGVSDVFRSFYSCTIPAPTGSPVGSSLLTPVWARGEAAYPRLASGNALLSLECPAVRAARFDPRLARTGGEDTLFFNQLLADGARIVWCAEAVATEAGSQERLSPRYLALRAFRGGQVTSWVPVLLRRARPLATLWSMGVGCLQLVVHGPLWAAHALRGSARGLHHMIGFMMALGKVFWMAPFRRNAYGNAAAAMEPAE